MVRKIIWLPELTLIEERPSYVAGVINMHGKIMPVIDLNVRFGHAPQRYSCSDRVIVLGDLMGIIVNEVLDVMDIPEESIEQPHFEGGELKVHPHFVCGEAKSGDDIVMILDPRTILVSDFAVQESEIQKPEITPQSAISYFCPEADRKERDIFHKRAINLKQVFDSEDPEKLIPVAVISMNKECVCVELETIREFSKVHNFTPVPCCPEHIAGNMDLRGNVLTVIDIRGLLNMQAGRTGGQTVIVADSGEFPVGVFVDEVLDVIYLRAPDIVPVTSSLRAINEKFVKGAVPYEGRMMAVLDFRKVLSWEGLIVDEEV